MAKKQNAPVVEEKKEDYQVIHLKYRPKTFGDVVGQRAIVRQLQGEIKENRIGTAYLFTGPRGVGKTSMARIFARALNCENGPTPEPCGKCVHCIGISSDSDLDVIEVDAATYTKKEETIELLEGIDRAAFHSRYKVYIIDEVHMFSNHSFNVLLKRLEEPPPKVVFILATTNPEKIPETVISRCRRLEFDRMDATDIVKRLEEISEKENVEFVENEKMVVLESIALSSEGGMRDAQVSFDQLISLSDGPLSIEGARDLLGIVESDLLHDLLKSLVERDTAKALLIVQDLVDKGRDLQRFVKTFTAFLRDAMLIKSGSPTELLKVSKGNPQALEKLMEKVSLPAVMNIVQQFLDLEVKMRGAAPARFVLEFALIKLTAIQPKIVLDQLTPAKAEEINQAAESLSTSQHQQKESGGAMSRSMEREVPEPSPRGFTQPSSQKSYAVLNDSATAEAVQDLPDVEVEAPIKQTSTVMSFNAESIDKVKEELNHRMAPGLRVFSTANFTLTEPNGTLIKVSFPARERVIQGALERPENLQVVKDVITESFGAGFRVSYEFEDLKMEQELEENLQPSATSAHSAPGEEQDDARRLSIEAEEFEEVDDNYDQVVQQVMKSKPKNFKDTLSQFPDFKDAIEMVRKHCGEGTLLFNGKRVSP